MAQVKALLHACDRGTFEGRRDGALVLLAFDTGLRANELSTLHTRDLDFGERLVRVTGKARPGQAAQVRYVPLSPGTLRILRGYLDARRGKPGDVLFCDRRGLMLTRRGFGEVLERLRTRAGIPVVTWHGLRRLFLTEAIRADCPEHVLARVAGHRDTRMLRRYLALNTSDLVRFHDRTSPARFLVE